MQGPFEVAFARKGDVIHVQVAGKMHGCQNFRELLYDPIKGHIEDGHRKFVLDLSATRFVDSIGVGYIMMIYTSIRNFQGQLVLCGMNERVHNLFHVVELDKVYRVYESSDEALAALAG